MAVAPPTKKRRLLTEHQKERLRERSPIPVLYNALDPSQDSSLPFTMDDEPVPERYVWLKLMGENWPFFFSDA